MRLQDNLVTLIALFIGIIIFVLSLFSFHADYQFGRPLTNLIIDVLLLVFSAMLIGGTLNLRKKLSSYEVSANKAFNEIIYSRLKPILEEMAIGIVEINKLSKKVENVERKISVIEELAATQKLSPEEKINFYFKSIIVMIFYIGIFIFMTQYIVSYVHLISSLLFLIWWLFITFEFDIFDRGEALIMLVAPPLIVPSVYLITKTLAGVAATHGLIFILSAVYAYYYYTIAKNLKSGKKESMKEKLRSIIAKLFSKGT